MRRFFYSLLLSLWLPVLAFSQFCGLESDSSVVNGHRITIPIDITSFVNNDLSDANQGVCEVRLSFEHLKVETMEVWLVSPNNDSIQLIGPRLPNFVPSFTPKTFDISFVQCSTTANPDPLQTDTWSNNNDFSFSNNYEGSYYPFNGCLEDLNTGPVNGQWKIVFQTVYGAFALDDPLFMSNFMDVELIFCDDEGNPCCDANAGTFEDDPITACEGDPSLQAMPMPVYAGESPDSMDFGFTYMIFKNGVLDSLTDSPDLTTYEGGAYEICGLSYELSDSLLLPDPADSMTQTELRSLLMSNASPLCADISTNCLEVTIIPPSETNLTETICQGDSFTVAGSTYTTTGTFRDTLPDVEGCDSIIILDLTVIDTLRETISASICSGDSFNFGGAMLTAEGTYFDTLSSAGGCDSVVTLNLMVNDVLVMDSTATFCAGDVFTLGDSTFTVPGTYEIPFLTASGCDSIVRLELQMLDPQVVFAESDSLSCDNPVVTLDGSASTPLMEVGFTWLDENEVTVGSAATLDVSQGGKYYLQLTQSRGTAFCTTRDSIIVEADTVRPVADAGPPDTLGCLKPQTIVGSLNSSQEVDIVYEWTTPDGNIVLGADQIQALVNAPGTYTLVTRKTTNGCTDMSSVTIEQEVNTPFASIADPPALGCLADSVTLDATASSTGPNFAYEWTSAVGNPITDSTTLAPTVFAPDTYQLVVVDTISGCSDTTSVDVLQDTDGPTVQIAPVNDTLTCAMNTLTLDASGSDSGMGFGFVWKTPDGGRIVSGANTLTPTVDTGGIYRLVVQNLTTGCADSAEVVVEENFTPVMALIVKSNDLTCTLNTVTLDAKGSFPLVGGAYQWSTADGNITTNTDEDFVVVDQPGTYQVVVQDIASTCTDSMTIEVVQNDTLPIAEAGPGFTLTCTTPEAPLNSAGSSFGPDFDYAWTGPCIVSGENTGAPVVNCGGTYILTITNTTTGCSAQDSVVVMDNTAPPLTDAGVDTVLNCTNPVIRLDGSGSVGGPGINYQWTGPGFLDGENTRRPQINQEGTYILDIINTTTGCTNSDTVEVRVDTIQPVADAGAPQRIDCNLISAQLGGSGTSTGIEMSYEWTTPDGQFTGPVDSIFTSTDSAGLFQLKVINNRNGCVDSSRVNITFDQNFPIANAGEDQELNCLLDTAVLGMDLNEANVTYSWTGPSCFLTSLDLAEVVVNCGGVYVLEAQNTDNGCFVTDTVVVLENTVDPTAVLPDSAFIDCNTGRALLDGSGSVDGQPSWYLGDSLIAQDTNRIEVIDPGTYRLIVQDTALGCADSAQVVVLFDCPVTANIIPPEQLTCEREIVLLDASASDGGGAAIEYQWQGPSNACFIAGQDSAVAQVACTGNYTVIVSNPALGITDSQSVFVDIDTVAPTAEAGMPAILTCVVTEATLDASGSSGGANISVLWFTFEDDTISNDFTATVDSAGIYIVEITDTSNGCTATDGVEVFRDTDVPGITFGDNMLPCDPDTLRLEAELDPPGGNYAFQWSGPSVLANADSLAAIVGAEGNYTLQVTNLDNGCITSNSVTVVPEECPPCVTVATPDTITCNTPVVGLSASLCETCTDCTFAWQTTNGNILSGADTPNPQVDDPGTYTLVVSDNVNGLSTTVRVEVWGDTIPLTVSAGPDLNIDCANPVVDLRGTLDIPGGAFNIRWYEQGNPGLTLSNTATLPIDREGTFVMEATKLSNGCVSMDEAVVGVDTMMPFAEAGPPQLITCLDDFARLEGENSSDGSEFSYEWTAGPGGNIRTGVNSANPIVNRAATYFLTITNTVNGCTAVDSVQVTENTSPPDIQPIADQSLNCTITSTTLTGNVPAAGNFSTQWCEVDESGDTVNCQPALDIDVSEAGAYVFLLTDQDNGCTAEEEVRVSVDTLAPLVEAGADDGLNCTTDNLTLNGELLSDEANISIEWTAQNGSVITNADALQAQIENPDLYFLEIENTDNGCVGTDSVFIALDDRLPSLTVSPAESLNCEQTQVRLTASASAANNQLSASWTTADGQIVGAFDVLNPRVAEPGTYLITVTDIVNGCAVQDSVVVSEDLRQPTVVVDTLEGTVLNCYDNFLEFNFDASTSVTGAGLDFVYKLNGIILPDNIPTNGTNIPGSYEVIGVDQGNGCRDTVQFRIRENIQRPAIEVVSPSALTCDQSSVVIDASNSAMGEQFRYNWSGPGIIQSSIDPLQVEVDEGGSYELMITDTINGCTSTRMMEVEWDTIRPQVSIGSPQLLDCQDVLIELDGSPAGANGTYSYEWMSVLGGNIVSGSDEAVARVDSAGVYTLTVTSNQNGCVGMASIRVEDDVEPIEDIEFNVVAPDCNGDGTGAVEIGAITGGVGPYSYAVNSDLFITQNYFQDLPPDTTHVLKVMDSRGCVLEVSFSFPEVTPLEVELGPDQNIDLGDSIRIEALVNRSYDSLRWTPAGQSGNPSEAMQVLKPLETTVYKVFVRDSLNCTDEETVIITVNTPESLFFPTAFSPDGNGNNDIYYIFADEDVRQIKTFYIFDRWGTLVFEQTNFQPNDPNFGWDGTHKGRRMKPAVFVFTAEVEYIDGRTELVKGDFVLLNR